MIEPVAGKVGVGYSHISVLRTVETVLTVEVFECLYLATSKMQHKVNIFFKGESSWFEFRVFHS